MKVWIDEEIELVPAKDPDVVRLQAALQAARDLAAPAAQAWADYCEAHRDDLHGIPFSRTKQKLYDRFGDTAEAVDDAEAVLAPVLEQATKRAKALWDEKIRQEFLHDLPAIEQFITMLAKYEETVIAAELAGVPHVLNVQNVFLTAHEVSERLAYAKKALSL
jgi:hypothetical protein